MMEKIFIGLFFLVLFLSPVLTFGHCYTRYETKYIEEKVTGCALSTMFFPLYWSVQLFEAGGQS